MKKLIDKAISHYTLKDFLTFAFMLPALIIVSCLAVISALVAFCVVAAVHMQVSHILPASLLGGLFMGTLVHVFYQNMIRASERRMPEFTEYGALCASYSCAPSVSAMLAYWLVPGWFGAACVAAVMAAVSSVYGVYLCDKHKWLKQPPQSPPRYEQQAS